MSGLKGSDIHWVVHSYIGVAEGYLGDFSYRTHRDFYPGYCDLEIDPDALPGTTRERFVAILTRASPRDQAAILQGILRKYPPQSTAARTVEKHGALQELIRRCGESAAVEAPALALSSELIHHALEDAATLLQQRGPVSALDRMHTALHAYLKSACHRSGFTMPDPCTVTNLLKLLRLQHPCLQEKSHGDATTRILLALGNIVDSLNPLRNHGSLAHPSERLASAEEALLAINATRTVIQYLDAKFSKVSDS